MRSEDQERKELDAASEARAQLAQPARPLYDVGYPMRELANRNRLHSQPNSERPDWQRLGYPSEAYYQQHVQKRVENAKTTAIELEKAKAAASDDYDTLVKVMLWGNDTLKPVGEAGYMRMVGVDFASITIDGCKLQLWDTAGQARYKSSVAMFRGAKVVVLFAEDAAEFLVLRQSIDSQKLIDDNVITFLAKPRNVQINTEDFPLCGVIPLDNQPGTPNMAMKAFAKIVYTMITILAGPSLQQLKAAASVAPAPTAPAAASSSASSNPDGSGSGNCCVM
jgi:hypothetical protein